LAFPWLYREQWGLLNSLNPEITMTHSKLHLLVLLAAMLGVAGAAYAQQPSDSATAPTSTSSTTPPPAAAPPPADAPPPGPSKETLRKARGLGMHPEHTSSGKTVYCWEDADTGTHFKTKKCVDEYQLQATIEQRQALVDQLQRSMNGTYGGK
jgi:hypothetical protein